MRIPTKHKTAIAIIAPLFLAGASQAALTLTNTDFEGGVDAAATPNGWTEIAANHGGAFYANVTDASGGTNHNLYMQGRGNGNVLQQSFGGGTADTQGTISLSMDTGWRNDPNNTGITYSWDLAIYNVTDSTILDSITYTLAPDGLGGAPDPRTIETARLFTFTYDNTDPALVGDEIAFRITTNSSANSFDPTGFIDNIVINAVPEPSSAALLGLGGLALILRRRRH